MFRKILLPGIVAGIAMLAIGIGVSAVFTYYFPSLRSQYENTSIFRPMEDPLMLLYFIHPFFLGIVLSWIWDWMKSIFPHESMGSNILKFAFAYWLISLSGMLISYSTFQVSFVMVASWTAGIFFESFLAAFVFSKMNP